MRCEDIRDRLIDVTAGDLSSADPRVRAHVRHCERCRSEIERTNRTWSLLTAIPDEEPDSAAMRRRFASAVSSHRLAHTVPLRWRATSLWPVWRPVHAAAVFAALVAGALIGRQIPPGAASAEQNFGAMRQELRDVREMLTLSLLHQGMASERIKGASAAGRLDEPRADVLAALVDTLRHDPSVNVRLACVRALGRFSEQPVVRAAVAQAVTTEESPLVSIALIDFIVEAMDGEAIDALRQLSRDAGRDEAVREMAARGVERLLGGGRL